MRSCDFMIKNVKRMFFFGTPHMGIEEFPYKMKMKDHTKIEVNYYYPKVVKDLFNDLPNMFNPVQNLKSFIKDPYQSISSG